MSNPKGAQKGLKGSYSRGIIPGLDHDILRTLPDEGSTIGPYRPLALNVRHIVGRLTDVDAAMVNGRLQTLRLLGYAASVQLVPVSQGIGWQITDKGKALLQEETA